MKRLAFEIFMILLLVTAFCFLSNLGQTHAMAGTVYIRADGSVEGTSFIESSDNVTYVLAADLNQSVVVERSSVLIDGNGHTLNGSGSVGATGFYLTNVRNVTVKKANIDSFGIGIALSQSQGNTISGNNITNSPIGISVYSTALNNAMSRNRMTNVGTGIFLGMETSNNTISENIIEDEHYYGLRLSGFNNTVSGNGILARDNHGDHVGIFLQDFINGNVYKNKVEGSKVGIWIGDWAEGNNVVENTVRSNYYGMHLTNLAIYNNICGNSIEGAETWSINSSASYNYLYHNNIVAPKDRAVRIIEGSNFWDDGYPSGGNYWSFLNVTDADLHSGVRQNETGSDGILDQPFTIQAGRFDQYPLAGSFNTFYAGTWNENEYSFDIVSNSSIRNFNLSLTAIPPTLSFDAEGPNAPRGFCRATILRDVMWCDDPDQWIVMAEDQLIQQRKVMEEGSYTYIYFNYPEDARAIRIQSVHAIPEFPSLGITLFFAAATAPTIIVRRKKP